MKLDTSITGGQAALLRDEMRGWQDLQGQRGLGVGGRAEEGEEREQSLRAKDARGLSAHS